MNAPEPALSTLAAAAFGTDDRPRVSPRFRLQWEEAQQAWVLLYPEGMVRLNGSAGEIIRRLDGTRSVAALIAELERDFAVSGLAGDVFAFLELAQTRGWIRR